ncbi:jg8951 [Pararge aegeria aegeria]|uniref:Jg8951 protein n=1 Tax=Pararge aegeria aegeria TaxID=348720 RepID=A0A8S4SBR7_9NEOP|nr:jg8951 [Pararge aegeria aegeria]
MVGRMSVWPGWPVDPRRSAGPAPHRPPRGAISSTRAPGSARPGDRLTPGCSTPSHQPTNRRTCLRRPARLPAAPLITIPH